VSKEKTLLPELLPTPTPQTSATPRERVAQRARVLLERFRGLGATAGAAMLGLQCTSKLTGNDSGYGVVDPMPPPAQACGTTGDPIGYIYAWAFVDVSAPSTLPPVIVDVHSNALYTGYRVDGVRVSGGTVTGVQDTIAMERGSYRITIAPAAPVSVLLVDVDVGCGAVTGTKHYRISYRIPDHATLEELPSVKDGGTD
jgi:hypothetical protein